MAHAKRYRRKKRRPFRTFVIVLLIFAIAATAIFFSLRFLAGSRNPLTEKVFPIKYSSQVDRAADEYKLDRSLIYAVIRTESRFNPDASSNAGAVGLMQLMPETFQWLSNMRGTEVSSSQYFDPDVNIDYGCYFLSYLFTEFDEESTVIAAYNAGHNKVREWLKDSSISPDGKTLSNIPYSETQKYVEKVLRAKKMYKKLYFS